MQDQQELFAVAYRSPGFKVNFNNKQSILKISLKRASLDQIKIALGRIKHPFRLGIEQDQVCPGVIYQITTTAPAMSELDVELFNITLVDCLYEVVNAKQTADSAPTTRATKIAGGKTKVPLIKRDRHK